jgi:DNA-binding transcriptional MerR regulator
LASDTIPNRPVFRPQEVCELAGIQPYVLRTWEAEFPDLGVAKSADGPRLYRRGDVERVLRLKHLLFVDGLTLAGARKQLAQEAGASAEAADDVVSDADVAAVVDQEARRNLREVRRGLQWILGVLGGNGVAAEDRVLVHTGRDMRRPSLSARPAAPARVPAARQAARSKPARAARPAARAKKPAGRRKR